MHWDHPRSREYLEGRRSLEAACAHRQKDAETLCALAESWVRDDESKVHDLFHQAVAVDATAPVALVRYLEFEIAHVSNNTVARLAAPMIRNAIDRCRKQIEARVNLPWAWASRALLHLLVEEPYEALEAIGQLICLCEPPGDPSAAAEDIASPGRLSAAGRALLRTRDALKRIQCIREKLPGFDWCQRAVLLGLAAAVKDGQAADALREFASWGQEEPHLSPGDKIVILSGGCTRGGAKRDRRLQAGLAPRMRGPLVHPFRRRHHFRHQRPGGRRGPAIRRPRAGLRLPAPVIAPRRPGGSESRALRSAVQFFRLRFQPARAAARLDRYFGRRRGSPARKASQLCRRADIMHRMHPCRRAGGAGWRGRRRDLAEQSPVQRVPNGKSTPISFSSPWTP